MSDRTAGVTEPILTGALLVQRQFGAFTDAALYLAEGEVIMILDKSELGTGTGNYVLSYWNAQRYKP
jgi:hypothetical protein